MIDKLEIGPAPALEDCESLGPNYNPERARLECRTFIGLIRRVLGPEPEGAKLVITSNPHDFGTYYEVAVRFDDRDEEAGEYAYKVESEAPVEWDDEARTALGLGG
ncbi:MAG: hypothetical protein AB7H90_01255 [Alphaproteobacteria bacterium]